MIGKSPIGDGSRSPYQGADDPNERYSMFGSQQWLPPRPNPSYGNVPYSQQQPSLLSANINLLEPFLLVTFLMFIVSLVEKVRFPSLLAAARTDFLQDLSTDATNITWNQQEQLDRIFHQIIKARNDTRFD
ncbi:unnamed protein product [Diamesa serratosioi]